MTTNERLTALEAFRTSAQADVYFLLDTGEWVYLDNGMRHSGGLALNVKDSHGATWRVDLKADESLSVRVCR